LSGIYPQQEGKPHVAYESSRLIAVLTVCQNAGLRQNCHRDEAVLIVHRG